MILLPDIVTEVDVQEVPLIAAVGNDVQDNTRALLAEVEAGREDEGPVCLIEALEEAM